MVCGVVLQRQLADHLGVVAAWKARWAKECLFSIVMGTLTAEPPRYSDIGDLDRRIRDMPLPKFAQRELPDDPSFCEAMMRFMPHFYIDSCAFRSPLRGCMRR